ncbi:reverse transcriptase domain-containing protein, partial [Tanacetum coccineum]
FRHCRGVTEKLQDKSDIQIHKFLQMFKKLHFNISFAEALAQMPNKIEECMALADLGASINLMPLYVWKMLMLPELVPTCMTLELANRSVAYPTGIAEDVFVQVDDSIPPGIENGIYDSEGDILFLEELLNNDPTNDLPPPKELKNDEIKMAKSSIEDPPELELKDLPPHLEYAFLEGTSKLPVIIAKDLKREEKDQLVKDAFGLCNAPWGTFPKVYGGDFSTIIDREIREVLWLIFQEKCHFMVKEGIVLDHKISKSGIEDLPFEIMCDASDFAMGAVLGQRKDKYFWPIHYASKTLYDAQTHYTTTEKELLAAVYAFEKFWSYLVLSKTIVYTDHSALKYLFAKQDAKPRLLRRCVDGSEAMEILKACHHGPIGGHHGPNYTALGRFGTPTGDIISDRAIGIPMMHESNALVLKFLPHHSVPSNHMARILLRLKRLHGFLEVTTAQVHNGNYAKCAVGGNLTLDNLRNRSRFGINKWYQSFTLRNFDLEDMELESINSGPTAKLPILKLGEYEMWAIKIKQYLQIQDYALWEVIENDDS